jgi:hypothetical protein
LKLRNRVVHAQHDAVEELLCAVYNNLSAAAGKNAFTQYIYDASVARVARRILTLFHG